MTSLTECVKHNGNSCHDGTVHIFSFPTVLMFSNFFSPLRLFSSPSNVVGFLIIGAGSRETGYSKSLRNTVFSPKHTPRMGNEISFSNLTNERLLYLLGKQINTE